MRNPSQSLLTTATCAVVAVVLGVIQNANIVCLQRNGLTGSVDDHVVQIAGTIGERPRNDSVCVILAEPHGHLFPLAVAARFDAAPSDVLECSHTSIYQQTAK